MNWFGPLWEVAVRISDIGVWFLNTADNIRPIPIVGEFLADFFDTIGNIFGWCAFYLGEANWRIESLRLDTFLENVRDWVMEIGGATNWEKILFHDKRLRRKSVCCVALRNSSLRRTCSTSSRCLKHASFLISCAPCFQSFLRTRLIFILISFYYEFSIIQRKAA